MDPNQIAKRLNQFRVQGQYQDQVRGLTGKKAANGQLILRDGSMTANEIYVRVDGLDANVIVAKNLKVNNNIANVPVLMKPVQPGSREYKIVDADVEQTVASFGNGATVAGSPALSGEAIAAAGAITVTSPMIKPFKMVRGPSGGLNVQVYGGWHRKQLFVTSEIDLTSARPATAGKQAWVLVYVDPETNTLKTVTGDEYDQGSDLHFSILADIPVPVGAIPVGGVVLTDTQTTIDSNSDIQDRRDWLDYSDADAVHTTISGEFAGLTEKVTPVSGDLLLIEDSADTNSKKYIQIGNLPGGGADFEGGVVINDAGGDFDFRVESVNDANALFVEGSSGSVGIGTNTPGTSVDIAISSTSTSFLTYPTLRIGNTSTTTSSLADFRIYSSASGAVQGVIQADGLGTGSYVSGSDIGIAIGAASNDPLAFITNATERMRLDTSGNFGVGTTDPNGLEIDVPVSGTLQGRANVRIGTLSATNARIYLEESGGTQWEISNIAGEFRLGETGVANWLTVAAGGVLTIASAAIHQRPATGNAGINLGRIDGVATTPFIDFNSGATAVDYDSRIIANGGTGSIGGGNLRIQSATFQIDGDINHDGSNVGFYGTTPVAKPTVSGSRGGNAALASLLTALASQGLITNSTTA